MLLNRSLNHLKNVITVPFTTYNNYYEVLLSNISLGNTKLNIEPINVMFDSGTTFTHFPDFLV